MAECASQLNFASIMMNAWTSKFKGTDNTRLGQLLEPEIASQFISRCMQNMDRMDAKQRSVAQIATKYFSSMGNGVSYFLGKQSHQVLDKPITRPPSPGDILQFVGWSKERKSFCFSFQASNEHNDWRYRSIPIF